MGKFQDLTGKRFGRLTVIKVDGFYCSPKGRKEKLWLCRCGCCNEIRVRSCGLGRSTNSCGCLRKETTSKNYKTHGKRFSRLYQVWLRMKQRCYNPKSKQYADYGGRGITICDEWLNDFQAFYDWAIENGYDENADYGQCTIDRIDVNGNYEPSNCRWVNADIQSRNKRSNIKIEFRGQTKVLKDWAKELGISYTTLYSRLHNFNWDIEKSFTKPVQDCGRKNRNWEGNFPFLPLTQDVILCVVKIVHPQSFKYCAKSLKLSFLICAIC